MYTLMMETESASEMLCIGTTWHGCQSKNILLNSVTMKALTHVK